MRLILALLSFAACHRVTTPVVDARDESCRRCLAQGRTWQGMGDGECTANCELQDTYCYRDACPGSCSRASCGNCLSQSTCQAASCVWNQSNEAMWCAGVQVGGAK